ncbi:MAG: TonB-dependent receptor [Aureispira sp.]|nr:TonB-dependent receptor [Aureispira sp.]
MFFKTIVTLILLITISIGGYSQPGSIRGKVVDKETGEPLVAATVVIVQTEQSAITDVHGNFLIENVKAGIYELECAYLGYGNQRVLGLRVGPGRVGFAQFRLQQGAARDLEVDILITAEAERRLEAALLKDRKLSNRFLETLSSEEILRMGNETVAEALKYIPNLAVEEDNNIVIRGLSRNYVKVLFNGVELHSWDLNTNAVSLDALPTAIIDNIIVYKSFAPDLMGNLGGGHIDLGLKSFSEDLYLKTSYKASFNTLSSFNKQFLSYQGSKMDGLGLGANARQLPDVAKAGLIQTNPQLPTTAQDLNQSNEYTQAFSNNWNSYQQTSLFNSSFDFVLGKWHKLQAPKNFRKRYSIGYGLMLTTQNSYNYYNNGQNNRYYLAQDYASATQLEPLVELQDERSNSALNSNILAMLGFKNNRNKVTFLFWNTHNTYKTTQLQTGKLLGNNGYKNYSTKALLYEQSGRLAPQLKGRHKLGREQEHELNWSLTGQQLYNNQPDWRYFSNTYTTDSLGNITAYQVEDGYGQEPSRYYRALKSNHIDAKFDASFQPRWLIVDKIKMGGRWSWADQRVREQQYRYYNYSTNFDGDAESFLGTNNYIAWDAQQQVTSGVFVYDASKQEHSYESTESIAALYAMADLKSDDGLHLSTGIRTEYTKLNVQTIDSTNQSYLSILPSMLLSYKTNRDGWFRLGYATTLGRPSMRELSGYTTFNYIGDYNIKGAADLVSSTIHNFDLRWEWFPRMRELVSVGSFFKYLLNPIDHVAQIDEQQQQDFVYRNLDDAWMVGAELELRKRLHFLGRWANDFYFTANFSYTYAQVAIDSSNWRALERQVLDAKPYRAMSKQPNYIANFILNYEYKKLGIQTNLNLNLVGQKLVYATAGANPNIIELPRATLNFNLSKKLGRYFKLQLGVENLLNARLQRVYEFRGEQYTHRTYPLGQTFWIGLSYQFKPKV